jgi:hypothetical protein
MKTITVWDIVPYSLIEEDCFHHQVMSAFLDLKGSESLDVGKSNFPIEAY